MNAELLIYGLLLHAYVAAGRAKWKNFKLVAPANEADQLLLAATVYGKLKMRAAGVLMVLTWPIWDYLAGAVLWLARKMGQTADQSEVVWINASELQPVATGSHKVRCRKIAAVQDTPRSHNKAA